jgi:TetR/AcrR family transcriptional repressor of nem operon
MPVRRAYENELRKSLNGICSGSDAEAVPTDQRLDDAIAFMALCVGGISLARAVSAPEFSDRILDACAAAASRIASTPSES